MKIVLLKDVANLGTAGEVKDVADGYARNFLMPKGFATLATTGLIKQAKERAEAQRKRDLKARTDAEAMSQRINGQTVRFVVKVGELDRLYGSITNVDVAEKLGAQIGAEIDRRRVELGDPIKRAGVYSVVINLGQGLEPRINVVVEGEGAPAAAPAAAVAEAPEAVESDEESA
jgi:large subunit ribosomal protein L9